MKNKESIYKGILAFKLENTKYVIKYIKNNELLLRRLQSTTKDEIQTEAFRWAEQHGNNFGNRFETELYDVFWDKVWYAIRPQK